MFGTYRISLALLVGFYHLVRGNYARPPAVFAFFVLSGFLMTLIINGTYADGRDGFFRYLLNRILRIYPGYYVAFGPAAAIVYFAPEAALRYSGAVRWPDDLAQRVAQFTIVGQNLGPRLVVTAWSLVYELIFYVFIGTIGRNRRACQMWFILATAIVLGFLILAPVKLAGTGSPAYVSLAFAAGAMIYHLAGPTVLARPARGRGGRSASDRFLYPVWLPIAAMVAPTVCSVGCHGHSVRRNSRAAQLAITRAR